MYCLKCRKSRGGREHSECYLKGGKRRAIKAHCEVCGTVMYQLLGKPSVRT